MNAKQHCFRPLTGIKVSEPILYSYYTKIATCFRPLTGIKVSEQNMANYILEWFDEFPSPHGD